MSDFNVSTHVEVFLAHAAMRQPSLSVVAGADDHRVVQKPRCLERIQRFDEVPIRLLDQIGIKVDIL